jgi:16S rRNA A1518/A1519 N6-dimethyltransferase RsmA/KsgA/DIM1 with predicted DNA glycosylase/AP lyase activity
MEFSNSDYGDVFADVYDAWYHDLDDVDAVVSFVSSFAKSNRVLELGVGTGRLAIPLSC